MSSGDGSGFVNPIYELTTTAAPSEDDTFTTTNGTFTVYNESYIFATTMFNNFTFLDPTPPSSEYKISMYIGGGLSILSCLIALFTYTSSRKFRVKRPYMITINLCVSLIIFYTGILLSVASMDIGSADKVPSKSCIAGAALFQLGVMYAWTWTAVHWTYLAYTVHKVASAHISHFVVKITLPAYGIPTILTSTILIANSAHDNLYMSTQTCFFKLNLPLTAVINGLYIVLSFASIAACMTYCILRLTCKKSKKHVDATRVRIKSSVSRLAVITCGVFVISMLELIRCGIFTKYSQTWFEVFNGIILGATGILLSVGLTLRSKEFRLYLVKKSPSTMAMRRMVDSFRMGRKRSERRGSAGTSSKSRTPMHVLYDVVRPPKPMPRESAKGSCSSPSNLTPSLAVPFFNNMQGFESKTTESNGSNSELADIKPKLPTKNNVENNTEDENGNKEVSAKDSLRKKIRPVSRINSLRQRVMKVTFRNQSSQAQNTESPQRAAVPIRPAIPRSMCKTQIIPEDFERASLASVDIGRKTSF